MPRNFIITRQNRFAEFKTNWMRCLPTDLRTTIEDEGDFFLKTYKNTLLVGRRNMERGYWYGYVGLNPRFTKLYGLDHDNEIFDKISVHGGLSFSGRLDRDSTFHCKSNRCCGKWYYGFDCGHFGDVVPQRFEYFA